MTRNQIINIVQSLANSQGYYSRLYKFLSNGSDQANDFLAKLESRNFDNELDLILYLEE